MVVLHIVHVIIITLVLGIQEREREKKGKTTLFWISLMQLNCCIDERCFQYYLLQQWTIERKKVWFRLFMLRMKDGDLTNGMQCKSKTSVIFSLVKMVIN